MAIVIGILTLVAILIGIAVAILLAIAALVEILPPLFVRDSEARTGVPPERGGRRPGAGRPRAQA